LPLFWTPWIRQDLYSNAKNSILASTEDIYRQRLPFLLGISQKQTFLTTCFRWFPISTFSLVSLEKYVSGLCYWITFESWIRFRPGYHLKKLIQSKVGPYSKRFIQTVTIASSGNNIVRPNFTSVLRTMLRLNQTLEIMLQHYIAHQFLHVGRELYACGIGLQL